MATCQQHETFWAAVDAELAEVPAEVEVMSNARQRVGGVAVARVTFASLGGVRVGAWLCTPASGGPHPGLLVLPGYKSDPLPSVYWARRGFSALTLAHRGKLGATSSFDPGYPGVLVDGIDDPRTYAYRGIYADSIRALEVLSSLTDAARAPFCIFGYSQGGPLATVAAARRNARVHKLAIGAPFLTAFPYSIAASRTYPYREITEVLLAQPERRELIFDTLAYFDALGFAGAITMPTLVYRGAADEICPPLSAAMLYERITAPKEWLEYPDAAHAGTNRRSLPDVAKFFNDGLVFTTHPEPDAGWAPGDGNLAAVAEAEVTDGRASAPSAREAQPGGRRCASDPRRRGTSVHTRSQARARRMTAHAERTRSTWVDLTAQHPGRATLHWVSFETSDGAVAGGYLSIPERLDVDAPGVLVQFPTYESVVSIPHPEDRERFTILTLAHRGQRGRGLAEPVEIPGLFEQPVPGSPWMLERIVDDCLLGLELLLPHTDARGPVVGVGPDWSLLVAASTSALTHLEIDDYWIEGFDPDVEEAGYPRRELTELAAAAAPAQYDHLVRTLAQCSPARHALHSQLNLLLVAGSDAAERAAGAIADAHAGPTARHRAHRDSATEAEWRDARRSNLLGVPPAQRWRYARAGVPGP